MLFFNHETCYDLSKKDSYIIITIAIPIKMYTGKTSKNPIIIDLVNVVASPTKKNIAKLRPIITVILFIKFFALLF